MSACRLPSGFAVYPFAGEQFAELLKSADTALYRSKRRGRGQITVYSEEIAEEMRRGNPPDPSRPCARGHSSPTKVACHFQPIVNLADGSIQGFEALARWTDREYGLHFSPSIFIPLGRGTRLHRSPDRDLAQEGRRTAKHWPADPLPVFQSVFGRN